MSRAKRNIQQEIDFVTRFTEACGTSRPAEIQRLLNITYQAARNYLNGRLPSAEILIELASVRHYSLHWLLTGVGEKHARPARPVDTPIPSGEMREFVRAVCVEVVNETLAKKELHLKVVELDAKKMISETVKVTVPVEK